MVVLPSPNNTLSPRPTTVACPIVEINHRDANGDTPLSLCQQAQLNDWQDVAAILTNPESALFSVWWLRSFCCVYMCFCTHMCVCINACDKVLVLSAIITISCLARACFFTQTLHFVLRAELAATHPCVLNGSSCVLCVCTCVYLRAECVLVCVCVIVMYPIEYMHAVNRFGKVQMSSSALHDFRIHFLDGTVKVPAARVLLG